jgi:hypothetical protein
MTGFMRICVFNGIVSLTLACGEDKGSGDVNRTPIADAGMGQSLSADEPVLLSGSGSYDPDGDPLTFTWAFDSVPEGSAMASSSFTVNEATDPNSSFVPDALGTFVVRLIVTDSHEASSSPDRTLIEIVGGEAPLADAGLDQDGTTGVGVSIDGSNSSDPLDRALTFTWSFAKVPDESALAGLDSADAATTAFTPDVSGMYVVALTVSNGLLSSVPDTAVVRISTEDTSPPVAQAGTDLSAEDCTYVTLDGSESTDPDGETLQYFWDLQSKPTGSSANASSFADRASAATTFFPDVAGDYTISLAVFDGTSWSTPDNLSLTVDERGYNAVPAVYPGAPQTMDAGEVICEEVGYSYICAYCDPVDITLGRDAVIRDGDSDPVTTLWEVVSGSATIDEPTLLVTTASLTSSQPLEPDACEATDYTFQLTATDCTGATATQMVTHQAVCCGFTHGEDSATDSGPDGSGSSGDGGGIPTEPDDGAEPAPTP